MAPDDSKKKSPERDQTDESLRTERERTDGALASRLAAVEDDADLVVQRARDQADAVLVAARAKADDRLSGHPAEMPVRGAVAAQRAMDDKALSSERASADENLRHEREENARALARLLPLEREKTDRYLLTERSRSDDALSHRDDFLSIVSHDLRNLLSGIVMSASLLADSLPSDQRGEKTLAGTKRIQRYAARMNRLIGDLVDVASIDAGKLAMKPTLGDAATVLSEGVDTFSAAAAEKGVALELEASAGALMAEFDHERLLQVLANLISNALKFTEEGGRIEVRGERVGEFVEVRVRDSGSGIPDGMLEAIFDRFWQVGAYDRRGMGLGLYISRCIVQSHGGRIWAESRPGEGTTLLFTLPGAPQEQPVPRPRA